MPAEFKTWTVTEPYLDIKCELGEGPYYEPETNTLRFVDIKKKQLHTVDLAVGPTSLKTLQLDMPVGVTANIEGVDPQDKILAGGKSGIYILERQTGKYKLLKRFYDSEENDERLRSNDGNVDPQGRFWIGTMNDFWVGEPQAEGEFTECFHPFHPLYGANPVSTRYSLPRKAESYLRARVVSGNVGPDSFITSYHVILLSNNISLLIN